MIRSVTTLQFLAFLAVGATLFAAGCDSLAPEQADSAEEPPLGVADLQLLTYEQYAATANEGAPSDGAPFSSAVRAEPPYACFFSVRTPDGPYAYRYERLALRFSKRVEREAKGEVWRYRYRLPTADGSLLRVANCIIPRSKGAAKLLTELIQSGEEELEMKPYQKKQGAGGNVQSGEGASDLSLSDAFPASGTAANSSDDCTRHTQNCWDDGIIVVEPPCDGNSTLRMARPNLTSAGTGIPAGQSSSECGGGGGGGPGDSGGGGGPCEHCFPDDPCETNDGEEKRPQAAGRAAPPVPYATCRL